MKFNPFVTSEAQLGQAAPNIVEPILDGKIEASE